MNNNDVFRKSDLGREEIKNQTLGVLPREARTLLIMIDGKKTYQHYLETLNQSKMFIEFGGVEPLFELLVEFQCIELVGQDNASSQVIPTPKPVSQSQATQLSSKNIEAEFDKAFSVQQSDKNSTPNNTFTSGKPDNTYEVLKSELATYIEKNAAAQEAWSYLLSLEQCDDSSQLLALAEEIQSANSGSLSRGMSGFLKTIKRQL